MIRYMVLILLFISCGGNRYDREQPLTFSSRSYDSDMQYLFFVIHEGAYSRIYNELFSDRLRQKISLQDFAREMQSFEKKYGPLLVDLSYIQSKTFSTVPFYYKADIVLEYKTRTIFGELVFSGSDNNMKLERYTFYEN